MNRSPESPPRKPDANGSLPDAPGALRPAPGTAPITGAPAGAGFTRVQWGILIAIGIGTFMSALDGSVGNIIQPILVDKLHSSEATVEWVLTVYLLVVSGLLLGMGRWGDMYGQKQVYLAGFLVFLVSSALCGVSPTAEILIFCRAVQAIGAAMLFASGPAILAHTFPPDRRGKALGIQLTMAYVGLTLGPLLGGLLARRLGWGSVFYINVPVGLPAVLLSWRFIPWERPERKGQKFDLGGAALFLVGLVTLLLALNQGHSWGWPSPAILGLFAASVVVLAAFFVLESRLASPMLDLSLFRNRLFSAASISALLNYIGLYSILYLGSFYLIHGMHYRSDRAGLLLAAQPLAMAVIASFSGAISDRIGTRWPTTVGMVTLAAGLFLLSRIGPETSTPYLLLALALAGLGTGAFVSPNNSAMLGCAPKERRGIASGIMATARNIGMVLGIGLAGAIFTTVKSHFAPTDPAGLFEGVRWGFLAACWVAVAGAFTSLVRER